MEGPATITRLLEAIDQGESGAADRLFDLVYQDLRALARARVRSQSVGPGLEPTALVHEVYLRLFARESATLTNRKHFFFAAGRAMRDILVEEARRQSAKKRGGDRRRVPIQGLEVAQREGPDVVLDLDAALDELEKHDARCAQIVRLRFFAELSHEEIAELLEISFARARREWEYSRAWLHTRLAAREAPDADESCAPDSPPSGSPGGETD